MGTRGAYGFYSGGVTKVTYNHFDSYPSVLGHDVLEYCNNHTVEEMQDLFDRLIMIGENAVPTVEQIEKYRKWANNQVGSGDDWYSLLREAQGKLGVYDEIEGDAHMSDSQEFLKDSLFCEWAYIINLDTEMLEIYKGFQEGAVNGRYGRRILERGYNGVSLIKEIHFDTNPNYMENLENELQDSSEQDEEAAIL